MRSLNNRKLNSRNTRIKTISGNVFTHFEREINEWLSSMDVEIISIDYSLTDSNRYRCIILYLTI